MFYKSKHNSHKNKMPINKAFDEVCRELHPINLEIVKGVRLREDKQYLKDSIEDIFNDYLGERRVEVIDLVPIKFRVDNKGTRGYDIASPDIVPHFLNMLVDGKPLTVRLQLPIPRGNKIRIKGTEYTLVKSTNNGILHFEKDGTVIINMIKSKIIITNLFLNYYCNGDVETSMILYSPKLHTPSGKGKFKLPLIIYPLLEYGVRRFLPDIEFGLVDEERRGYDKYYVDNCEVAIFSKKVNPQQLATITQILYMFKCLPNEFEPLLNGLKDERNFWFDISSMLSSNGKHPSFSATIMRKHLDIIGIYNERYTIRELNKEGVPANTFQDILLYIIQNYIRLTATYVERQTKRIEAETVVYQPILTAITRVAMSLTPGETGVANKIRSRLRDGAIYSIIESKAVILSQQVNVFNGIHASKQDISDDNILENKIPKAGDMSLYNIDYIPTTTPYVASYNPYYKTAYGMNIITEEDRAVERELQRGLTH